MHKGTPPELYKGKQWLPRVDRSRFRSCSADIDQQNVQTLLELQQEQGVTASPELDLYIDPEDDDLDYDTANTSVRRRNTVHGKSKSQTRCHAIKQGMVFR